MNCINRGAVTGYGYVGGIAGYFYDEGATTTAKISSSCNSGEISAYRNIVYSSGASGAYFGGNQVGGIVGHLRYGKIYSCYNKGRIGHGEGQPDCVGGVIGCAYQHDPTNKFVIVVNSYNEGEVFGNDYVGGFAGDANGEYYACYNAGKVSGGDYVAGFAGVLKGITYVCCLNVGPVVTSSSDYGLFAAVSNTYATQCYACTDFTGDNVKNTVGSADNSANVSGKSMADINAAVPDLNAELERNFGSDYYQYTEGANPDSDYPTLEMK